MRLTLIFFTAILLLSACHRQPANSNIWKVEVATSECFGTCQNSLTVIDSNLNYHFYGGRVAKGGAIGRKGKIFGFYTAKVSRRFWDSLTTRLEENGYQSLDTGYQQENDAQFLEIRVHYGKQVKRIHGYNIDLPDGIVKTINWVAHSYITIRPVATKDTIKSDIKYLGDWER
jgi:hypothetical protein